MNIAKLPDHSPVIKRARQGCYRAVLLVSRFRERQKK